MRGNEGKLETMRTRTKVMRTKMRDKSNAEKGLLSCHCRCLPEAVSQIIEIAFSLTSFLPLSLPVEKGWRKKLKQNFDKSYLKKKCLLKQHLR